LNLPAIFAQPTAHQALSVARGDHSARLDVAAGVSDRDCAGVSAAMLMLLELIKALVFAVEPILSRHLRQRQLPPLLAEK
jgi:hypothetical protein